MAADKPAPKSDDDDLDQRLDDLARVVKDYLREGDAFLVQCQDDEILVEEAPQVTFQRNHPRLYGRLLSLNEQMESGCAVTIVLFILGAIACLGLHEHWWDDVLGPKIATALNTWWFFVPLFVALFFLGDSIYSRLERRVYRRGRTELLELLRGEGFDRDTLVPMIQEIPEFERVVKQLKLDPGPFLT